MTDNTRRISFMTEGAARVLSPVPVMQVTIGRPEFPSHLHRLAGSDHSRHGDWQHRSTHRTSAGAVSYARCACGAWLVLLDGQLLATAG
jgi:hypothetical protein